MHSGKLDHDHSKMTPLHGCKFKILECDVDSSLDEILRDGIVIKVEPRSIRVLLYLAEHPKEVVSVEELLHHVWADVVVTPDSVYQAVAALRRALGDHSKEPRYIANVPRRGYRLLAPLVPANDLAVAPTAASPPAPPVRSAPTIVESSPRRRPVWRLAAGVVAALAGLSYLVLEKPGIAEHDAGPVVGPAQPRPISSDKSIAVLPFVDLSENHDQAYFAAGIAEEVLDLLVAMPQLRVIGRTSSFQFKAPSADLRDIGTKLGVAYVVKGTVRKAGARIRVTAQLIETSSGLHLWADSYDREFGDILVLQSAIATGIARTLQIAVGADDPRPVHRLQSTEAYALYLRGRSLLDRVDETILEAPDDFEQALALDPSFLRAAEALSMTYAVEAMNQFLPGHEGWQHAREAAERALRIDPNSAAAHGVLGMVHAEDEFDWDAAEAEFTKALNLNPRDPVTLEFSARAASHRGANDLALRRIAAAIALDPLNPDAHQNHGFILLYLMNDLAGAEAAFRRSAEISPTFYCNHLMLGTILLMRGEPEAALPEMQAETDMRARDVGLAVVNHALGRKLASDAALARFRRDKMSSSWPAGLAEIYAYRGEQDNAFAWLDKAYAMRDPDLPLDIRRNAFLTPVRDDQRYLALLRRMNLPK